MVDCIVLLALSSVAQLTALVADGVFAGGCWADGEVLPMFQIVWQALVSQQTPPAD